MDDPDDVDDEPQPTEDDLYFDALKKRDLYNVDYTDIDVDEIRSETYKMEQFYHGDENTKQTTYHPKDNVEHERFIDSTNLSEFGKILVHWVSVKKYVSIR